MNETGRAQPETNSGPRFTPETQANPGPRRLEEPARRPHRRTSPADDEGPATAAAAALSQPGPAPPAEAVASPGALSAGSGPGGAAAMMLGRPLPPPFSPLSAATRVSAGRRASASGLRPACRDAVLPALTPPPDGFLLVPLAVRRRCSCVGPPLPQLVLPPPSPRVQSFCRAEVQGQIPVPIPGWRLGSGLSFRLSAFFPHILVWLILFFPSSFAFQFFLIVTYILESLHNEKYAQDNVKLKNGKSQTLAQRRVSKVIKNKINQSE